MRSFKPVIALLLMFTFTGSWADDVTPFSKDEVAAFQQSLTDGTNLIAAHKAQEAIPYFEKVSAAYEERYKDTTVKIYCARSPAESLLYLVQSTQTSTGSIVLPSVDWAYSYYLKGYALIELGNYADAKPLIEKAIEMMPQNAQFLSELGHINQVEKNWDAQIAIFQRAEKAATGLPKENGSANLARAWRGIAFALTEQGKLDESEAYYKKCLELNANDQTALSELRYIQQLRAKQGAQ